MNAPLLYIAGLSLLLLGGYMTAHKQPRGIRNHNPLNVRVGNDWEGETGLNTDGAFEQFESPVMGIRAAAKLLRNYRDNYGLNNIAGIIDRWAPGSENNTTAYIMSVSQKTGIAEYAPLTPDEYPLVIAAMVQHENGMQPYSLATIQKGFELGYYA